MLAKRKHTYQELAEACRGINPEPVLRWLHAQWLVFRDERQGVLPVDRIFELTRDGEEFIAALDESPAN